MTANIHLFVGAKGGSGTTTLVKTLAGSMRGDGSVAAVDADLCGRRALAVTLDGIAALDGSRNGSPVSCARVSGITLCELADRYDAAFALTKDAVEQFLITLEGCSTILVDAPQPFAAAVRPFVARATRMFVVLEPTLLGVAGARSMYGDLQRFGVPPQRIAFISNCREQSPALKTTEIDRVLSARISVEIPALTNRSYWSAISKLSQSLRDAQPEPTLALAPSSRAPIGDRRSDHRRMSATQPVKIAVAAANDANDALKAEIHQALLQRVDLASASRARTDAKKLAELRAKIEQVTSEIIAQNASTRSAEDLARLRQEVVDEALGLGPLESLLGDDTVTEIMVNGPSTIYVERAGKIERTNKAFANEGQLRLIIERIITPVGRRVDEASPMVDARLKDGSRVNAIIDPLALDGAMLTIRRFGERRLQSNDLVRMGAVTEPVIKFLQAAIEARLNIVISGGTGSGKTTFLNVLSAFLPPAERIITIEDAAELLLVQPHVGRLESRPANIEGRGEIRIRDLLRNALRMRPDRIIIGECRGAEALDMLQAMNTGHDGSLTTIHANSPRDALSRIETMVLMAGFDLPVRAIREQVASALDLVIHTARLRDGSRKVTSVSEVTGMEGDVVTMQELISFRQRGVDRDNNVIGEFQYSGVQPKNLRRFNEYGVAYDIRGLSSLPTAASW